MTAIKYRNTVATDETKVRLTAFWVLLLTGAYLLSGITPIFIFMAADFALRSFNLGRWSPLFRLSCLVSYTLKLKGKPVYLPAKRFAARIGFVLSVLVLVFALLYTPLAMALSIVLAFFAALESLAGFCAGCYLYTFIRRFAS